ncbi:helix-turn-helix domain-containing protein [Paenibacillus aurantius]|uniref:helix-turn-helix domain-containing protein n=1 Tax=Paenibacillus aurantius TaxID=2918900 RepID=UPI00387FB13A
MVFSKVIKDLRKELKLIQEQLARELDLSFSTIDRWENEDTNQVNLHNVQY